MQEQEDQPIPQRLRVVTVLDATPGQSDDPEGGRPIAIVTLGYQSEVEQPLLLYLREVKKLAGSLLAVMAHFGSEAAAEFLEKHTDGWGTAGDAVMAGGSVFGKEDSFVPEKNPSSPSEQRPSSIPLTGLTITVRFQDRKLRPMELQVIGAYRWKGEVMAMYRCTQFGEAPVEGVLRVLDKFVKFKGHLHSQLLPKAKWAEFSKMLPGRAVAIGQRWWKKMPFREIETLVKGKRFHIAAVDPVTPPMEMPVAEIHEENKMPNCDDFGRNRPTRRRP